MRHAPVLALAVLVLFAACEPLPPSSDDAGAGGGGASGGGGGGVAAGGGSGGGAGGGVPGVRRIVALAVGPLSLTLAPSEAAPLTAEATYDDGSKADVSGSVTWTSSAGSVAQVEVQSVDANAVIVRALASGTAEITAKTGAVVSPPATVTVETTGTPDAGTSTGEVRAVWVTRFAYSSASGVRGIIDRAAAAGFNVVFFQIRGNGDAFYRSNLVPWSKNLTGTLGQDPGWDPLQVAITEAHAKGMQLHAYFNVFSAWPCSTGVCACRGAQGQTDSCVLPEASAAGAPTHWLRAHPESLVVDSSGMNRDSEYFWFSPGNAAYRAHVVAVARELLTNYDVDGLHLDRIRYPGTWASYDAESNATYAALPAPKPTRADWERQNVDETVGAIYDAMKQVRPSAVLSASVWGIYQVLPGCNTSQGYAGYFQDSLEWVRNGRIDWLVPMIYWDIGTGCTDWSKLADGFVAQGRAPRIVAGMHALDQSVVKPARLRARIEYARSIGAAGTSVFASTYLDRDSAWSSYVGDGGVFTEPAAVPAPTWR